MQRDYAYRKLQDLLLQELQHKQLLATQGTVEDFLQLAAAKRFYIDDLIRMVCPASRSPRASFPCGRADSDLPVRERAWRRNRLFQFSADGSIL